MKEALRWKQCINYQFFTKVDVSIQVQETNSIKIYKARKETAHIMIVNMINTQGFLKYVKNCKGTKFKSNMKGGS